MTWRPTACGSTPSAAEDSAAYWRAMDIKGERMLDGDYEPEGKLAQHLKDVELILEDGHAARAPAAPR